MFIYTHNVDATAVSTSVDISMEDMRVILFRQHLEWGLNLERSLWTLSVTLWYFFSTVSDDMKKNVSICWLDAETFWTDLNQVTSHSRVFFFFFLLFPDFQLQSGLNDNSAEESKLFRLCYVQKSLISSLRHFCFSSGFIFSLPWLKWLKHLEWQCIRDGLRKLKPKKSVMPCLHLRKWFTLYWLICH